MGTLVGLHPSMPTSFSKSSVYFLCESAIPLLDRATSMPREYLKGLSSFFFKFLSKYFLEFSNFHFIISNQDNVIHIYIKDSDLTPNRVLEENSVVNLALVLGYIKISCVLLTPFVPDVKAWSLSSSILFSPIFQLLVISLIAKSIWKSKSPSKIKAFKWILAKKKVNTNYLLQARKPYKTLSLDCCTMYKRSGESIYLFIFLIGNDKGIN